MIQTVLLYIRALILEPGIIPGSVGASAREKSTAELPKEVFAAVGVCETG
jgi:hypothetical protein